MLVVTLPAGHGLFLPLSVLNARRRSVFARLLRVSGCHTTEGKLEECIGIHARPIEPDPPVKVRTGRASGLPYLPDDLAALDRLAVSHRHLGQVKVHGIEA